MTMPDWDDPDQVADLHDQFDHELDEDGDA
jgi:hypothetical protein